MKQEQSHEFVRKWYKIVEKGLAKDPEQAESIALEKATKLIDKLNEQDSRAMRVLELTRNPLLLSNICLVHRHRGGFPKNVFFCIKNAQMFFWKNGGKVKS